MITQHLWLLLDLLLAAIVLGLGWAATASYDLRRSLVFFIAFGLFLAIVWARLNAPDLALAEAAIGAGLSGALLLAALKDAPAVEKTDVSLRGTSYWLISLFTFVLTTALAWALVEALMVSDSERMAEKILALSPESGVTNPVTAVLLNFRAYDTLLELGVLLIAGLGILASGSERQADSVTGAMFAGLIRWLVPLLIVTAGYLLWTGAHAPGGAFQAGAVLAAAAVLLRLGGHPKAGLPSPITQRLLLVSGVGIFLVVGAAASIAGLAFLEYPAGWSGLLILVIESAATLSVATTLTLAYLGGQPADWLIGNDRVQVPEIREQRP